ncbi:hypothetical protein ACFT7S_11970 [Streptomyces sp. NPDC057136]|uniref:hypothetical protein n=1 Tax=Streptomyces sp. NPDC057136 TaxID=3346029 RepID=UPI003635E9B1
MTDLYDPNRHGPSRDEPDGTTPEATGNGARQPAGHGEGSPRATPSDPAPAPIPAPAPSPDPTHARAGADEGAQLPPVPDSVSSSEPARVPSGGEDADRIRIGLWGAPRSGKTTYLAALPIAAMQYQRHHEGAWNISGMTPEANAFLSQGIDLLTRQRTFPEATMGIRDMAWSVQGPQRKGKWGIGGRRPSFVLDIQDAAGEVFGDGHPQQAQLVGRLARAQGLIYLFDPLGDAEEATENFNFLQSTLTQLTAQVRNRQGLIGGRLPHHVSVCIAKFDHPDIFKPSAELGWVKQDTEGAALPRVPEEQGEQYFQWMCDDFRGSNARLVRDALYAYFDPRRISYYATSAIGFRFTPQHVFDYNDYVQPVLVERKQRLRTSPVPINVLEPLIDLEERVHRDRSRERRTNVRRGRKQR